MIPYGVKLAWMILCTTGTATSWVVLWAFAKAIDSWWLATTYCVATTFMVFIFDLGAIWHFTPSSFPEEFCFAQMALVTFSALMIVGVCTVFNLATIISVIMPSKVSESPQVTLKWRYRYLVPILFIPALSATAEAVVVYKLNANQQHYYYSNSICDVTNPLWPKLLGYAGIPLLEAIPCFTLAFYAALRIYRMHKAHQRLWDEALDSERFGELSLGLSDEQYGGSPSRESHHMDAVSGNPSSSGKSQSLGIRIDVETTSSYEDSSPAKRPYNSDLTYPPPSIPPDDRGAKTPTSATPFVTIHHAESDISLQSDIASPIPDRISVKKTRPKLPPGLHLNTNCNSQTNNGSRTFEQPPKSALSEMTPPPKHFLSQIWRLLLFQAVFAGVVALLSLSTLIRLIQGRPPMEFGTEHVSGIGAAWGPVLIFGHSPGVRRKLNFWRRE